MWFLGHRWILTLCSFLMLKPYCMHFTFVTPEVAVTRRMSRLSMGPAVMIQWWMGITVSLFLVHPDRFGFKLPFPNPGDVGQLGLEPHPTLVNRPHSTRLEMRIGHDRNNGNNGTEVANSVLLTLEVDESFGHTGAGTPLASIENRSCSGSGDRPIQEILYI